MKCLWPGRVLGVLLLGGGPWMAHSQAPAPGANTNQNAVPEPIPALPLPPAVVLEASEAQDAVRAPLRQPPPLEPTPPLPLDPPRYGGLIGDAMTADRPLQLLNPLAPPEYGDGSRNLSVHPTTGRVEGISLFSIKLFKSSPKPAKVKKRKRAAGD